MNKKQNTVCRSVVILGVILAASGSMPHWCDAWDVALKDAVLVRNDTVHMRDVVAGLEAATMSLDAQSKIMGTLLCHAPQPGKSRSFSRSFIAMKLKNNGIDITNLAFNGAHAVCVERAYQLLPAEVIKKEIEIFLCAEYGLDKEQVRIHYQTRLHDLSLPSGILSMSVQIGSAVPHEGKIALLLRLAIDGIAMGEEMIHVTMQEKKYVLCARTRLVAGAVITAADIYSTYEFVSDTVSCFSDERDVIGKVAKSMINENTVIEAYLLRDKPLVRKGDMVRAVLIHKSMEMCMNLKALEDGVEHEAIALFNPVTKKHMRGTVVAPALVEVIL